MTLEEKIKYYFDQKTILDTVKKDVDKYNNEIKIEMGDKDTVEFEDLIAKKTVSVRETLNETKLLTLIKSWNIPTEDIIKTKEYIDMDALENAIYNGFISQEQLEQMSTVKDSKEVITLKVSKKKA